MERITYRDERGEAKLRSYNGVIFDAYARLAAYEDTGIAPEDVRPVVRGRWREVPAGTQYGCCVRYFECSACKQTQSYGESDFCPWCGADMREAGDGTEH